MTSKYYLALVDDSPHPRWIVQAFDHRPEILEIPYCLAIGDCSESKETQEYLAQAWNKMMFGG